MWSPRQEQVRDAILGDDSVVVVVGPVQSGKTFSAVMSFHLWAARSFRNQDFIFGAKSQKQLSGSIVKYSQQYSEIAAGDWRRSSDYYTMRSNLGGVNRFYPLLGGTKGTEERARSFSAQGALLDEATLLDSDFVNTVEDRLSRRGAKMVLVCNPAGPLHPIKTNYVDDEDVTHIGFSLADNPSLDEGYIARLNKRYSGAQFQRMVLGEWAQTEGLVYPHIGESVSEPPRDATPMVWTMGIDFAHSSSTHVVAVARLSNGQTWVMDEWEHTGSEKGVLSVPEQAQRIIRWAGDRNFRWAAVDPSAPEFKAELRRRAPFKVVNADTDLADGIQYVRNQTENGQLWISRRCRKLISQMHNYSWDERAGLLGLDKPIKQNDHGPDALRYAVWTSARPRRTVTVRRKRGF